MPTSTGSIARAPARNSRCEVIMGRVSRSGRPGAWRRSGDLLEIGDRRSEIRAARSAAAPPHDAAGPHAGVDALALDHLARHRGEHVALGALHDALGAG